MSNHALVLPDEHSLEILNSIPFGVYFCDRSGIVRYINEAYAEYIGDIPQNIIGHKISEFLPRSRAMEVMKNGIAELYDRTSVREDAKNSQILVNRIPVFSIHHEVVGMISQLMTVGDSGWTELLSKLKYAEQVIGLMESGLNPPMMNGSERKIVWKSNVMTSLIERATAYALTDETVLILGPSGVGKELFANAVHKCSNRAKKPFIVFNCASVSRQFVNSELFGYAPGAFTGASRSGKPGLMELADQGTLFLDEIGDLDFDAQGILLRVLETHMIQRINATSPRFVNFRLVAATNKDLRAMVREHRFREDLFYRLNVLTLSIPPLAERKEDILPLVKHFLEEKGMQISAMDKDCLQELERYSWPGNVRELRNVMTSLMINAGYGRLKREDLPFDFLESVAKENNHEDTEAPLNEGERAFIETTLLRCGYNMTHAAKKLNIARNTLYAKMKKYGIKRQ